jgi:hypothetical protein
LGTKFKTKTNVQPYFLQGQGLNWTGRLKLINAHNIGASVWGRPLHFSGVYGGYWSPNIVLLGDFEIISVKPLFFFRLACWGAVVSTTIILMSIIFYIKFNFYYFDFYFYVIFFSISYFIIELVRDRVFYFFSIK